MTIFVRRHECPACGAGVLDRKWDSAEWRNYRRRLRTPICPECAALLALGPLDLYLRLPTVGETFAAHLACEDIWAIQETILRAKTFGASLKRVP
jgi:hypothetical protein